MKKETVRLTMFQTMIIGTEIMIAMMNLLNIGCQPRFGLMALIIRWVKITLTAKSTTTLFEVSSEFYDELILVLPSIFEN